MSGSSGEICLVNRWGSYDLVCLLSGLLACLLSAILFFPLLSAWDDLHEIPDCHDE